MNKIMTPIPQNYKNNVNWILGAYTDAGVSFPNGFQKDAIQNAVGARKTNKWRNWSCNISLITNEHGTFVVVEDCGTLGLIGQNKPAEEVSEKMARGEQLSSDERLVRFSSMFNSGNNTTGSGLFGAGKSVYSVASTTYTYYYDSLRSDNKYVANLNRCGQVLNVAHEGDEAYRFIKDKTGLEKKDTYGTRVIIESPTEELVQSISDGSIIPFIQESWWRIIQRLEDPSCISINNIPIAIPKNITAATHKYDLKSPEYAMGSHIYRVKNFGLYIFEDGSIPWTGISYYRKGMKIGQVDLKDIPTKIDGKFWGYIEVDDTWEAALSEIEDKVHFGVSKGKKNNAAYQILKNYCNEKFHTLLIEWGYIKDKENEDKKIRNELKQIAEDIQDLFDKLGFEDLGKGPQKSAFDVRWQDIKYPQYGTERVTNGDTVSFTMRIKSTYLVTKKFQYKLFIKDMLTGKTLYVLDKDEANIKSNDIFKKSFSHVISNSNSTHCAENRIVLIVKIPGSGKEIVKELPYFFDIDKPDNSRNGVVLTLHECIFPNATSRRVNFGEIIKNVCYRIENKRNEILSYRLNVSIHNASDPTCPKIINLSSETGTINPFGEIITPYLQNIVFDQSLYEQYLSKGILELRARLIANNDDSDYEKGDKITFYHFKIFLNSDEKHGKNDAFDVNSVVAPGDYRRSWFTAGSNRTITLNIGHTAYLNSKDYPDIQHEYMKEQMLKQYVLLYLAEGKYDMFGNKDDEFTNLEPQEAADKVIEKIERVYSKSLA